MASIRRFIRSKAFLFSRDAVALWFAVRHPATPWSAKLAAALTVAYALSPIDLVPDVIPLLGLVDDVLIVPLGMALAWRLTPFAVTAASRARAARALDGVKQSALWLALLVLLAVLIMGAFWWWKRQAAT